MNSNEFVEQGKLAEAIFAMAKWCRGLAAVMRQTLAAQQSAAAHMLRGRTQLPVDLIHKPPPINHKHQPTAWNLTD
jgi:hypothetical protein